MRAISAVVVPLWLLACGSEDHVNIFHTTFSADSVRKDYTTPYGFTRIGLDDPEFVISYCAERNDPSPCLHYLLIKLPSDVKAGDVITDPGMRSLIYMDEQGRHFDPHNGASTMTVTITAWPGPGGYGKGTFSATLYADDCVTSTVLSDGVFEGWIVN